ncbi:MAG: hypothetical protein H0U74_01905 [Bradymonadaceae bacterium]|nr:hypothetical protein [Lujinxingiaceae bacterium]
MTKPNLRTIRQTVSGATLVTLVCLCAPLHAQTDSEDLALAERTVLGWASQRHELIVRLSSRGDRMVGGVGHAFHFEATELYRGSDGAFLERFRSGAPMGPVHPLYFSAKPPEELQAILSEPGAKASRATGLLERIGAPVFSQASGLEDARHSEAHSGWSSPKGGYAITIYSIVDFEPWEHPRRGTQFKCVLRQRAVMLDSAGAKAYELQNWLIEGEPAVLRDDAVCPQASVQPSWHEQATHWALVHTVTSPRTLQRMPEVVSGDIASLASRPAVPFVRPQRALTSHLATLPEGALRSGLQALLGFDNATAEAALQKALEADAQDLQARLGLALLASRRGDVATVRQAARTLRRGTEKDPIALAQLAAMHGAHGPLAAQVRSFLDPALRQAAGFDQLVLIADWLFDSDLGAAARVLERALAMPGAEAADPNIAHALYVAALQASGHEDRALSHIGTLAAPGLLLRTHALEMALPLLGPEEGAEAVARILFENPGNCRAYFLAGRTLGRLGQAADSYRQFAAAAACDPTLAEAHYFLGDLERLRGNKSAALAHFHDFLRVAPPRRADDMRAARHAHLEPLLKRLAHQGVVLQSAECRPIAPGAILCQGFLENTLSEPATNVELRVIRGQGRRAKVLGTQVVERIEAGQTQSFGLRLELDHVRGASLEVGRNADEKAINRTTF